MTERVTPSSEEIAAALEVAIEQLNEGRYDARGAVLQTKWSEKCLAAMPVLHSHLSRLREEARFRDAAMALAEHRAAKPNIGTENAWYHAHGRFTDAMDAAFRALEEPRDEV